jgi:hypothetical protein
MHSFSHECTQLRLTDIEQLSVRLESLRTYRATTSSADLGLAKDMARSSTHSATVLQDIHQRQRADGPAAMLGIGTAIPTSCVLQDQFADWYFHVTKSDHLAELKAKIKKICENLPFFN